MKRKVLSAGVAVAAAVVGVVVAAPAASAAAVDFAGALNVGGCSGSVVRMPASVEDDKAFVLTNGHCYEGPGPVPGEVLVDEPSQRVATVLDAGGNAAGVVQAVRAAYVTMTGTDITLYQLDKTYRQLQREFHVRPLTVSAKRPTVGTDIRVVSGGLKKIFSCTLDQLTYRVLETGYVTNDVLRYTSACQTGPGSSGSPVVDAATGEVIGINNTSNRDGGQCTLNNPCEMDRDGVIGVHKGIAYGTETYWLTTCVTRGNRLDLHRPGCLLPQPAP
ncbi:serine protease [Amycolatopsis rhabdoformis]|uniref:Serine protease n=1 Tax=Amycolatopsis rhabdoformis TaxID=1448059 RepID=A0ABZ1I3J2_9PSEU|nr:serine protease [Amycolatopsis rhabdoformis]WSE28413.1 serine protease [Amycolatopsis rhabdoformis]